MQVLGEPVNDRSMCFSFRFQPPATLQEGFAAISKKELFAIGCVAILSKDLEVEGGSERLMLKIAQY